MKPRPPFVTFLMLVVLLIASWYTLRLVQTFNFWDILIKYHSYPGPLYQVISSLVWIISGLFLFFSLLKRKNSSIKLFRWGMLAFIVWWWIDRLFFQFDRPLEIIPIILTFSMILLVVFGLRFQKTDPYFRYREKHE